MRLTSEQREFILAHEREDTRETALRSVRGDMPLLLSQIAGRQVAEKKIPSWYARNGIFYPPHISLEQASSELTARYKASLVTDGGATFADLTGGMGVDFSFLSPHFREAAYVERNKDLCRIAAHNFRLLGLKNATLHCADTESFLRDASPLDFVYLDPSRRDNSGQKVFRMEDCTPGILEIKPLLIEKSETVMVKYSPMLDISLAVKSVGCVNEVHIVSVDNECKELLLLFSKTAIGETGNNNVDNPVNPVEKPRFVAVNLKRSGGRERFSFTMAQEKNAVVSFAGDPGRYLYEPNASILKAGAFKSVARAYNLLKLHVNSHLYTSDKLVADFPGRIFEVKDFFLPNSKNVKSFLQETKKANITVRNFPLSVASIRRKTGLKEGGDIYLFATTLAGERRVWIVCKKDNRPLNNAI